MWLVTWVRKCGWLHGYVSVAGLHGEVSVAGYMGAT